MTTYINGDTGVSKVQDGTIVTADIGDGQVTPAKTQLGALPSCIRLNTANGYGSTNTRYRRFTNTVLSQGTDVTYTDSATLGSSFTINTNGVYSISYIDQFTASDVTQLSLNDTSPTGSSFTNEGLANSSSGTANTNQCASWTGYLASGSVIRARSQNGSATGSALAAQFTITRVA